MLEQIKRTLNSTRFWSLLLGASVVYLQTKGFLGEAEMMLIGTVLGGYITLNTVSKFEKK